ncbi:MAG: outer membrane beta-barrel protein, partial [Flavobacteriales bacterium]
RICLLLMLMGSASLGFSQEGFKGGVVLGLTTTQVSGDGLGGWDKFGLVAGAWVDMPVHPDWSIQLGMSYVNKGSKTKRDTINYQSFGYYLNYIDVPILLQRKIVMRSKFNGEVGFGPYIGLLLNQKIVSNGFDREILPPFERYDIGLNCTFRLWWSNHLYTSLAFTTSVLPTRPNPSAVNPGSYYEKGTYNQTLQFCLGRRFGRD